MIITVVKDRDYVGDFSGMKMRFYYKKNLEATVEIRTIKRARETLNAWARLKLPIADVVAFQKVSQMYVGCTVDDVSYNHDGTGFLINGKALENI